MSNNESHSHTACLQEYLEHLKTKNFSQKTLDSYRHALGNFLSFIKTKHIVRLYDVTQKEISQYQAYLYQKEDYTDWTRSIYLRTTRQFFAWLEQEQIVFISPAADLVIPRVRKAMQPVPSEQEVIKLLEQPDTETLVGIRDRAILEILYSTGIRLNELIGMEMSDTDLQSSRARIFGKGRKERMVPLGKHASKWLQKYINEVRPEFVKDAFEQQSLWLGVKGKRLNALVLERIVKDYAKQAGIETEVTPHALRRACATHMLRNGAHPVQIQMLLGHSTLKTLDRYIKASIEDIKASHMKTKPGK